MKIFGKSISKRSAFRIGAVLLTLAVLAAGVGIYAKYTAEREVNGQITLNGSDNTEPAGRGEEPTEAPVITEAPAVTEAPAAEETPAPTEEPAVTEAPAETPAPTEEPVKTVFEAQAPVSVFEGDDEAGSYLYIEIIGEAEPEACWAPVEKANGKHGGSVYVFAMGGAPTVVDPDAEGRVLVTNGEGLFAKVSYEAFEEASVYGYLIAAYEGESVGSLFNGAE